MAKVSRDDVLKLAKLAKLQLTDEEIARFAEEIPKILEYVEQLQNVDVTGLEPTSQVTGLKNVMRKDKIIDYGPTPPDLLKNAPEVKDGQFKVRKIL